MPSTPTSYLVCNSPITDDIAMPQHSATHLGSFRQGSHTVLSAQRSKSERGNIHFGIDLSYNPTGKRNPAVSHARTEGTRQSGPISGSGDFINGPHSPMSISAFVYPLQTDRLQGDKATEIRLLSFARPHMRAFHYAWLSFFVAFFGWFSIPPLLPTIKKQLKLSSLQINTSNTLSVSATIVGRVITGAMCDKYGSRNVQAVILTVGSVPVAAAAFMNDYHSLLIIRFFIGLVGCSFVATASWTSSMFSKQVVGLANALACGWGNLGAGAAYLIVPLIFALLHETFQMSESFSWRFTLILPAIAMFIIGVSLYLHSDDCPQGDHVYRRADEDEYVRPEVNMWEAMCAVSKRLSTWILVIQYGASFGIEITVHNVLSLYYYEDFDNGLSQTTAGLVSSLFGLNCIFARALGGYLSDWASSKFDMTGRLVTQFLAFLFQSISLFIFSRMNELTLSVPALIVFAIAVQVCTGTTYGIVPYVSPEFTGAVSGVVGAGGNLGALCWSFIFQGVGDHRQSFMYLSFIVFVSSLLTAGIQVKIDDAIWKGRLPDHTSNISEEKVSDIIIMPSSKDRYDYSGSYPTEFRR